MKIIIGVLFTAYLSVTKDTKLQDFQYKLIHKILTTNSFLYKCGLKETELCTFCTETKESLVHIFCVRNFWLSSGNFLKICGLSLPFNAKDIILGLTKIVFSSQQLCMVKEIKKLMQKEQILYFTLRSTPS